MTSIRKGGSLYFEGLSIIICLVYGKMKGVHMAHFWGRV